MHRLGIVIASTRPGRVGGAIGEWFARRAEEHGRFQLDVIDLAELDLPFLDEPNDPVEGIYLHRHTLEWSARVRALDAFAFVMPEYNHGYNAPLKNALDYLYEEWNGKPVGFVSYGGIAGGTRAVQAIKNVVVALEMVPISDAVVIPRVSSFVHDDRFRPTAGMEDAATTLLDRLHRVADALTPLHDAAQA